MNPGAILSSRDLVLIGAGHTNLHVVRMWRMRPIPDVRLTLVSPVSRAAYSGMLPGTLAGLYEPDEMEIDLWRLCESGGVRLIVAEAVGFEPEIRHVLLADRPPMRYDVASIGIGSVPGQRDIWAGRHNVLPIKPLATFRDRFDRQIKESWTRDRGPGIGCELTTGPGSASMVRGPLRIAIVGAGAGGVEVAFGVEARLRAQGVAAGVSLIDAHADILAGYSAGTVRRAREEFRKRAIVLYLGKRVLEVRNSEYGVRSESAKRRGAFDCEFGTPHSAFGRSTLLFDDQTSLPADIIIWATAASPPQVLSNFHLPKTDDGFLAVRSTLQTTADFPVFVVGDTASFATDTVPKAGVYAVREGPVLQDNLERLFAARPLRPYRPQRGFLSILSTGDGRAIVEYKGFSGHGRWTWRWKDHIDRKFMRLYRNYRPQDMMRRRAGGVSPLSDSTQSAASGPMRCFGCGSKIASDVLAAALQRLDIPGDPRTLLGLDRRDDAVIIDRLAAPIDVLTVDIFPAFLDDPYLVGRIAAIHALSDLWAMGSDPQGAMAIVTLPAGSPAQQTELLYQLLAGGLRELSACDATLWGGHTTEGSELSLGYSVAGKLDGRPPFAKDGLRPGDRLILTKPLGTATLLAAHRECRCEGSWLDGMLARMLESNRAASIAAREFGARAATDVTGFGLAGHLLEMLDASRVSADLSLSAIPLLDGFAELSAAGFRSSLDRANRRVESRFLPENQTLRSQPAWQALFDPQTSGGLLIATSAGEAESLQMGLRDSGHAAAIVGIVTKIADAPVVAVTA